MTTERRGGAVLRIGVVMALTAGIVDVSVALLQKPRGFETFAALAPPILALAAALLAAYLAVWGLVRPRLSRAGAEPEAPALALASMLGVGFMMALLAGLQSSASESAPHALFRLAIIVLVAGITGGAVYLAHDAVARRPVLRTYGAALGMALPVLMAELLVFQWLEVYAIDSVTSLASLLAGIALAVAALATVAFFLSATRRGTAAPAVGVFVVALATTPILGLVGSDSTGRVEASADTGTRTPPRILLISIDTLRADALSAYRPDARRTAAFDRLAADGVLFERAIAPSPWTLPSLTSVLSGLSPAVHQATGFTARLSNNITTLAEHLERRGYHTGAIVHNDLLHPKNNLAQGFAEYSALHSPWYADSVGASLLQAALPALYPPTTWPTTTDQTRLAVEWLESNRERDFFLWLHYFDPHAPYEPRPEYISGEPPSAIGMSFEGQKLSMQGFVVPSAEERRWIRGLYDGEVQDIDANVGRIIETLERLRLYDDTLIVVTSDHGEEFWEHGALGHGHTIYDELLKVPLIVKLPGSAHRGRAAADVSTTSITPTILDVAGIEYRADDFSAPSLLPLLVPGHGAFEQAPLVSGAQILFDRREGVRFDGFKYIVSRVDGREELYALDRDPGERRSLAESEPERLETGRALLRAHAARAAALVKRLRIEEDALAMDEDTLRRLRSLGYLR